MKNICLECATSGISQTVNGERCSCCGTVGPATITPREFWESRDEFIQRAMQAQKAFEAAVVENAPEVEEPALVMKTEVKKARCPHYLVIREFAAIARKNGLDMKAADRARGAMGVYLGVKIQSRADLTAAQWNNAITGLRAGVLFW